MKGDQSVRPLQIPFFVHKYFGHLKQDFAIYAQIWNILPCKT